MSEPRLLNYEERSAALLELLEDEPKRLRITMFAQTLAFKTMNDADDLLNEAVTRVLDERRVTWMSNVPANVYLAGVIRSVASQWWKEKSRMLHQFEPLTSGPEDKLTNDPSVTATAEVLELFTEMLDLFSDDPIARRIFFGIYEGALGEELRLECGLTPTEYATKRRLIRRRISQYLASK